MKNMNLILTPEVKFLARLFDDTDFGLRVVGGAVRDALLDHTPKDIDLGTNATPEQMLSIARDRIQVIPTGIAHGTLTFMINGVGYEITTLRVDMNTDGRHADVAFTNDWKLDAQRRDFTFNAMSVDPMTGELFDYFGGLDDLHDGIVRFVGDPEARIKEDYLRLLRFWRFLARFGTDLTQPADYDSWQATIKFAPDLSQISGERIWMEMAKIIAHPRGGVILDLMKNGVLEHAIPTGSAFNKLLFDRTARLTQNPVTRLATMVKTPQVVNARLKLSSSEFKLLNYLVARMDVVPTLGYVKDIAQSLDRHYAKEFCAFHGDIHTMNYIGSWDIPTFPVSGDDLIALGHAPGREMGAKLMRMKQAWKDSDYALDHASLLTIA